MVPLLLMSSTGSLVLISNTPLMQLRHIFVTSTALFGAAVAGHGVTYLSMEQAGSAIFPGKKLTPASHTLSPDQKSAVEKASGMKVRDPKLRAWRTAGGDWFLIDDVIGKHEYITYAVGISASGKVTGVEIMEYRETYGDQIRNPKWRAQFSGKDRSSALKLDKDIQNISGATLSCRHVTDGVKRLLAVHDLVLRSH
jgi:hypothetical protein